MKVYEVECRAVITLAAEDMQKAALHGAAVIKDNPHLIYVRAIHQRSPAPEDPGPKNSQKGPFAATLPFTRPDPAEAAEASTTQNTHEETSIRLSFVKSLILSLFQVRNHGRTVVSTPFGAFSGGPT